MVSLKSLIVIKEFYTEGLFIFCFLRFIMLRHHFWIIRTLVIMTLAYSIYLRVMYPLKTFWILVAAISCSYIILLCENRST